MLKGGCVKQDIDPQAAILDHAAAVSLLAAACSCCDFVLEAGVG